MIRDVIFCSNQMDGSLVACTGMRLTLVSAVGLLLGSQNRYSVTIKTG